MADDTNKEVPVDFRSLRPLGEFKAEWNGKFKKTDTFQFVVRFDNLNSTAVVDFERNSAGNEQRLHLEFTVEQVLKLDAKLTLYFSNGSGMETKSFSSCFFSQQSFSLLLLLLFFFLFFFFF